MAVFSIICGLVLLGLSPATVLAREGVAGMDLDLSAGYRVDQLDWNIAGNIAGTSPNILSELTWEDLESYQVTARGRLVLASPHRPVSVVLRSYISYGDIYAGRNQDSDYFGDNRTREFSRSNNQADAGSLWDSSLGGGMVFFLAGRKLSLTPLLGFSYHAQNLTIQDGYQTLSDPSQAPPLHPGITLPPIGPIAGLDSRYETEWRSGWLGLDLRYQPLPVFSLQGTVEIHGGQFRASGDWNLRDDLRHPDSFKQNSDDASGLLANLGLRVGGPRLQLSADLTYQEWRADDGESWTYFSDGTVGLTRLNEVNWRVFSVNAGLTLSF